MLKHFLAALILISACHAGPARAQDAAAPFDGEQALIDAETPSGDRRARMIAGFNRGYNGFQQTYRTCTPAASVAIRRYIEEGSKISRDLTARYAN